MTVVIHVIGWGILFGFPILFQNAERTIDWGWYVRYCIVPLSFMVVFYTNYYLLIDRYLFRRRITGFIIWNLLLIVAVSLILYLAHEWLWKPNNSDFISEGPKPPGGPRFMLLRDSMMLALTAGLSVAIRMTGNWYKTEAARKEEQQARTEAELQNLRSQINPHFLFNTLNNIYSLIAVSPDKAQDAVHGLSRLLRHVLYQNNEHMVPLSQELDFVRSYVELMSLRLPASTRLSVEIDEAIPADARIAPLLFITLIENAFKHGISADSPSFVEVRITVEGGLVKCRILNSYFPKADDDRSGSGIGMDNLARRLLLLYPGRYILHTRKEGYSYVSELTVKY